MPDLQKEYFDLRSRFADCVVDLTKALTAYEAFPPDSDRSFDRLEGAVSDVSYSLALLSFARRAYKKSLAKKGERS